MRTPVDALFIGQAPPRKVTEIPFGRTRLWQWLASAGISQEVALERCAFTALVDFFPGLKGSSHRAPSPAEIAAARPHLLKLYQTVQPRFVVPVGALSAREVLADETIALSDVVGQQFLQKPFGLTELPTQPIIPLPHPSGASRWIWQEDHQALLRQALLLIRKALETSV